MSVPSEPKRPLPPPSDVEPADGEPMAANPNDDRKDSIRPAVVPDIGSARLSIRPDVKCSLQDCGGEPFYMLEDLLQARFFRVGLREWEFIGWLDGKRTLREAVRLYRESVEHVEHALNSEDILALCNWMLHSDLLQSGSTCQVPERRSPKQLPWWLNPMFIRIPLFNPDPLIRTLLPWLAWTLSRTAVMIWTLVCLYGLGQVYVNFERFSSSFAQILAVDNWIYLLLVWVGLKILHEIYHGLICKKYGGHVPRCGIMLIMFSPIAFVDVTSSWRFRSKWQRIYTAAGGIYVEFFVAAVAAIIWSRTEAGVVNQVCHNIVTMASIATVLFNCNFLMKFDGYYILTDWLEIQNLYSKGQQYLRYLVRRYLLAVSYSKPRWQPRHAMLIRVYAFAALAWRLVFYIGILIVAATMFHGAGIVMALLAGGLWFFFPAFGFIKYLVHGAGNEQPNRLRFAMISTCCLAIVISVASAPWPAGVSAPAVVEYAPLSTVRVNSGGFVKALHVLSGDSVKVGDLLVTLENPQLVQEYEDVKLQIKQSKARCRMLQGGDDVSAYQVEKRNCESLVEHRDELEQKVATLTIRARQEGQVISRDLGRLIGQYVKSGTMLLAIGNEEHKELTVSVGQSEIEHFVHHKGTQPHVRIKGRRQPIVDARLAKVDPKASISLPNLALAAPLGGPLTVTTKSENGTESNDDEFVLLAPRFVAKVALPPTSSQQLRAGEIAKVKVGTVNETVGEYVYSRMRKWLLTKLERATAA